MPLEIRWTPRAERDLLTIRAHIAADSPMAAGRIAERMRLAANGLADFPGQGRPAGASRVLLTIQPYVIRYTVRPDEVVILSVRHGRRRIR